MANILLFYFIFYLSFSLVVLSSDSNLPEYSPKWARYERHNMNGSSNASELLNYT